MRNPFKFARPKGPGYGISSAYYLSVLATTPTLPSIFSVVNPGGDGGAVEGFGAPLAEGAPKDVLGLPMSRGSYVLASKDRKTVLRMLVFGKEEVGFDGDLVAAQADALNLSSELKNRIRATWTIAQLRFEAHDPDVGPSLDFILAVAQRLGHLVQGSIADPLCERYLLPEDLTKQSNGEAVSAREHIVIRVSEGEVTTRGMSKFALPELKLRNFGIKIDAAVALLSQASQSVLDGNILRPGASYLRFSAKADGEASLLLQPLSGSTEAELS